MAIKIITPESAPPPLEDSVGSANMVSQLLSINPDSQDIAYSGMAEGAIEDAFEEVKAHEAPQTEAKLEKRSVKVGPGMVYPDSFQGLTYDASPRESFDTESKMGSLVLAAAEDIEQVYGLEAAADTYLRAKDHLLQAISLEDVKRPVDIALWLQAGNCLSKLVQTTLADEYYEGAYSRKIRKGYAWKQAAENTFMMLSSSSLGKEMATTDLAAAAIVVAEGLGSINAEDKAKTVLEHASELIKAKDGGAENEMVQIVKEQAFKPKEEVVSEELQDAARDIMKDLTTGSHRITSLAA